MVILNFILPLTEVPIGAFVQGNFKDTIYSAGKFKMDIS